MIMIGGLVQFYVHREKLSPAGFCGAPDDQSLAKHAPLLTSADQSTADPSVAIYGFSTNRM